MLNTTHEVEDIMRHRKTLFLGKAPVFKLLAPWLVVAGSFLPALASADVIAERLAENLSVSGHSMPVKQVSATPMEGIYHVRLESGESFYSNADGSHFLVGDLYQNGDNGLVNLTEQARNQERAAALAAVPDSERVVFQGMGEPKATIVVFTDPSCPYCVRLHESVPALNELGIAVHYMAFPRAGMGSAAATSLEQVWCSDNPSEAMNQVKQGQTLSNSARCDNPVSGQYELGMALGVQGTPAIILPDGQLIPGFVPPERLVAMLGLEDE
ncbi:MULTISPECIES: DsbC family protein [unclassified Halomonas]|uniref:DsbC family protein n=1 Tax=unclassified Halomonas TaxID=2609666 RepID=UPI0009904541|nr:MULTISPECIES: DsbC family protein [unclassified Halomonas]AQU83610.1 protein-disulfide isomerase [Halomonas sp. 'Soap Lake \